MKEVCIIDFNVSKDATVDRPDEKMTLDYNADAKVLMRSLQTGTPLYAAPERFEAGTYTEQIDMWAAGIVLYMMITGDHPFDIRRNKRFDEEHAVRETHEKITNGE